MEDVKNFVPDFVEQEQEREIIIKLGHMVTNRIPYKLKLKTLTKRKTKPSLPEQLLPLKVMMLNTNMN